MTMRILGFFDSRDEANQAREDLVNVGIARSEIDIVDRQAGTTTTGTTATATATKKEGEGEGRVEHFFKRLFGMGLSDRDTHYYAEGVRRGGTVLCADIDEANVDIASDILDRDGAIDVDRRFETYKTEGFTKYDEKAPVYSDQEALGERERFSPTGQFAIPVVEEKVRVAKRPIERGIVRVINRITETPVDEEVRLREEHYEVQRKPVDRPVNASDMEAFKEGNLELTEKGEELLVEKEARVKEEVVVKKDVDERVEQVHETARRTDVEVERNNPTNRR